MGIQPIVPPEDLAAEQDFRWRPSGRDLNAAAAVATEGTSRRRAKPRPSSSTTRSSRRQSRTGREREPVWGERASGQRGGGRRSAGARRDGGGGDEVVIGQLRRKQRQLADREHKCQVDLEKVSAIMYCLFWLCGVIFSLGLCA